MWYLYILECKDGTLYTGITSDLIKRIIKHNRGKGAVYTRLKRPVRLIYWEEFPDKVLAAKREKQIKSLKRREKIEFIKSKSPHIGRDVGKSEG